MEIIGILILGIVIIGFFTIVQVIVKQAMCADCPLKEKCEQQVKDEGVSFCDNNNGPQMMPL